MVAQKVVIVWKDGSMEGQMDKWMIDRWTSIGKLEETGPVHKVIVLMS